MKTKETAKLRRGVSSVLCATALAVLGATGAAWAQDYPNRPITLVAPSAGGSGDWAARVLAAGLEKELGQTIIVENRANVVGIELTAESKPDGYHLLFYGSGMWVTPLLRDVKYDVFKDFQPISRIATSPAMVAAHPSLGIKSIQELLDLAKAKPGALNFSAGQVGSSNHRAGELFKSATGANMVYVPYKGTGPGVAAAVAGETQVTFATVDVLLPHVEAGRLVPLAVMALSRSKQAPEVPTAIEAGLPDFEVSSKQVLWAPAGLPEPILKRLNEATLKFLNSDEAQKTYFERGLDAEGSTPEAVTAFVKSELDKYKKLIKEIGVESLMEKKK